MESIDLSHSKHHLPIVETASLDAGAAGVTATPVEHREIWRDEDATRRFAALLAAQPALADCFIALYGDLGAGKTTLVRHLLRALGVTGRIKSPTYAVVEPYLLAQRLPGIALPTLPGSVPAPGWAIWHFDFYRFGDPREWEDAGFRDIFASLGLKIAEWPDKAGALLPAADLSIAIEAAADDSRSVHVRAGSAIGRQMIAVLIAAAAGGDA